MCGRYSFSTSREKLKEQFHQVQVGDTLKMNFNIAPTQPGYVITDDQPHQLQSFVWGLVPFWAKDRKIGSRLINARAESIADKPSFRQAVRRRRCWVLADSFYEWKTINGKKQPYRILSQAEELLVMAGIWEVWKKEGHSVYSYAIITTEPNQDVMSIHDRMPVILHDSHQRSTWLGAENFEEALDQLHPPPDHTLRMYPVSTRVNNVRNNDPTLHEPLEEQGDLFS